MLYRPRPRISRLLAFLLVPAVTVVECLSAEVKVRPPAIDFGARGHNESPRATIELVNDSPGPVRITRVKPSCSCIRVSPANLSGALAPGRAARVTITMSSGRAFGRLSKYVEVSVSGERGPIGRLRVPVSMRVFENYRLTPRELRFEGEFGGSPVTRSVLVEADRRRPGERLDLKFVGIRDRSRRVPDIEKFFEVRLSDDPRGARITASLSPHHPEGRVWGELVALLEGKPLILPIAGDMFRGILLSPRYFNFNRVEAAKGATHVEQALLRAIDGHAFEIVSLRSRITRPRSPKFSVEVEAVELEAESRTEGREHLIRARLVAPGGLPAGGSFSGKVTVRTTHPEKPEVELGFFGFFAGPRKRHRTDGSANPP